MKILILADDLSGSLDTGVQFSKHGIVTNLYINRLPHCNELPSVDDYVIVCDTESRHMSPEKAYQTIYDLAVRAQEYDFDMIYKKTDSGLRGNIGAELSALLDGCDACFLPFIPAYPQINRLTIGGVQYIDSVPLTDSVFGKDPFEPVLHSYVPDIILSQSTVNVYCIDEQTLSGSFSNGIGVFDVSSEEQLQKIADLLLVRSSNRILAGCAGFASVLFQLFSSSGTLTYKNESSSKILILCGSINPISLEQIDFAKSKEVPCIPVGIIHDSKGNIITPDFDAQNVTSILQQKKCCVLYSQNPTENNDQLFANREAVANCLGSLTYDIISREADISLVVVGGDTLLGFLKQDQELSIQPIKEFAPGTVISLLVNNDNRMTLYSKSGGFGKKQQLYDIIVSQLKQEVRND